MFKAQVEYAPYFYLQIKASMFCTGNWQRRLQSGVDPAPCCWSAVRQACC